MNLKERNRIMNKIATTIEQSKKLIELGIDVNTADMVYLLDITMPNGQCRLLPKNDFAADDGDNLQAWSFTALLSLVPIPHSLIILDKNEYRAHTHKLLEKNEYKLICVEHTTNAYEDPFDAVFEAVKWLLKNKKI